MIVYEYKVVPAPVKGLRARGVKGTQGRFANALQTLMNDLAADGWEYQRADTLPAEERQGLTSKVTVFQNMLIFRRAKQDAAVAQPTVDIDEIQETLKPKALPAPEPVPAPPQVAEVTLKEGKDFGALDGEAEAPAVMETAPEPDASFFSSDPLITQPLPKPQARIGDTPAITPLFSDGSKDDTIRDLARPSPILAERAARLKAQATAAE